jgi:peptidoglycan/xylan/chitin deacetylase (PgdA/CDA1 family)
VADIVHEGARARATIERELGQPVTAFAYPYGDFDQVVQHLIGACGYVYGLTCRAGKSRFQDNLLALPRIEVAGTQQFQDFIASLV